MHGCLINRKCFFIHYKERLEIDPILSTLHPNRKHQYNPLFDKLLEHSLLFFRLFMGWQMGKKYALKIAENLMQRINDSEELQRFLFHSCHISLYFKKINSY